MEPNINGGNRTTMVLLYRRTADRYFEQQRVGCENSIRLLKAIMPLRDSHRG